MDNVIVRRVSEAMAVLSAVSIHLSPHAILLTGWMNALVELTRSKDSIVSQHQDVHWQPFFFGSVFFVILIGLVLVMTGRRRVASSGGSGIPSSFARSMAAERR